MALFIGQLKEMTGNGDGGGVTHSKRLWAAATRTEPLHMEGTLCPLSDWSTQKYLYLFKEE